MRLVITTNAATVSKALQADNDELIADFERGFAEASRAIADDFRRCFAEVDIIAGPTAPTPAFRLGEKVDDPVQMYLNDIFTVTVNMAGLPGIAVPAGSSKEGLPLGLQLIGKAFDEETLFRTAAAIEQVAGGYPAPKWW